MYEKCITCSRIGQSCVPNLMRLPFPDLIQWCNKRQKYIGWTNQHLADDSKVPVGTINRIKAGDYLDCKYSTIRNIVIALIGGTSDEFPCNAQVEKELHQMEELEKQAAKLASIEKENEALENRLDHIDELHRNEIRIIKTKYQEQIDYLLAEVQRLRSDCESWRSENERKAKIIDTLLSKNKII